MKQFRRKTRTSTERRFEMKNHYPGKWAQSLCAAYLPHQAFLKRAAIDVKFSMLSIFVDTQNGFRNVEIRIVNARLCKLQIWVVQLYV